VTGPRRTGAFRPPSVALRAVRPSVAIHLGRISLLRALSHALGDDTAADEFLRDALDDSGMAGVPEGREAFVSFVREEVLPRLMPIVRLERLHDLVRRTIGEEGSLHPPPLKPHGSAPGPAARRPTRPRVIVIEPDPMRRVAISRALVRDGFDVEGLATAEEALHVEAFHAIVMPLDEGGERVVAELAKRRTRAGLVTFDDTGARDALRRAIEAWPTDRVAIVGRDAQPQQLCSRVRIVLE
jgi:hypothetical protein